MAEPVGFLITWTCYGTWLYGDERGSVDGENNAYGTPYIPPDKRRIAGLRRRMGHPPFRLTKAARELVTKTIEEHCRYRGWELLAVNARSNHVHVVIGFAGVAPEMMMGEWKHGVRVDFGSVVWWGRGSRCGHDTEARVTCGRNGTSIRPSRM
ncbi:MAG: hypothetical protein WBE26_14095 [Phycisphaerae bacterium]